MSVSATAFAQHIPTLDEVVYGGLIKVEGGSSVNWLSDGEHYSKKVKNPKGGFDIVSYEASSGNKKNSADEGKVLIPASMLVKPGTSDTLSVRSFTFDSSHNQVLIYTNTRRVWRYDTRGDYWVLNTKSGRLTQLGANLPESSLMFAKFSPDGSRVAYVSKNNIYVENIADNKITRITNDGSSTIVNGTFDWVYEEEFDCRDGFRWSPDGKYIAYWQSDTEGTGWFDIINNVDSLYPKIIKFPYPKAGTANSAVKVGYVSADGGDTHWIDIPGNARENYIMRMDFIPDSDELFIQQMNRQQNTNKVWIAKIGDGSLKNILTEKDSAWVETNDNITWMKGNKYFTWVSERNGWRHLYRVSRDGKEISPITKGDFDFIQLSGMDLKKGLVYFIASPDNYTQRYLYSAKLFGNGEVERVSPEDESGQHRYQISPNGKFAVHTFSNAVTPPVIEMVALPSHKTVSVITENKKALEDYRNLKLSPKEFVKTFSGDLELDAWMIKPVDFDPSKKYPVIIDVYGEPAGSTVQDVWGGGDLWHQYLANKGYIVVSIENRGAAAPRGREWRKCIYGEVGTFASQDQARGILDLARQYSFIDTSRIGITGWSGGGSQTLNCMFRYPDVFSTGIAIAFVADQRLYDTIYQERYMNTPQNNPEGYRKGSPISYVEGLKGNLLLIHGTGDDNVHYQSCEMLVNELVKHGKVFYQLSYPMRSHSISEREGTTYHLRKSMTDYFLKNLPAGGR
ncbi:MAG: S9 family peptidase [Phocaeicola sp.]|nr:S9 family peptidase [Phocaeicola sp.]